MSENIINTVFDNKISGKSIIYTLKDKIEKLTISGLQSQIKKDITGLEINIVEINMSEIEYIDSLRLGEFIRLKKSLQEKNVTFRLINPTEKVKFVIESASLEPFLLEDEKF